MNHPLFNYYPAFCDRCNNMFYSVHLSTLCCAPCTAAHAKDMERRALMIREEQRDAASLKLGA